MQRPDIPTPVISLAAERARRAGRDRRAVVVVDASPLPFRTVVMNARVSRWTSVAGAVTEAITTLAPEVEVKTATLEHALHAVEEVQPAVVVLAGSGLTAEATREVVELLRHAGVAAVVVVASSPGMQVAGADAYLREPPNLDALLGVVERYVGQEHH